MVTLTIGPVTDYLYTLAQSSVAGVIVNGKPAVAFDGEPNELTFGMFVIGISQPPPNQQGDTASQGLPLVTLGVQVVGEDYTVPFYIDFRMAGQVQKTVRDLTLGVFAAFCSQFLTDMEDSTKPLYRALPSLAPFTATAQSVGTASEPGVRYLISGGVRCRNWIDL